jgi:NAD(P)-dependent dehydrogenase (short-subunit alcohol dehydrogenase family)
MSEKRYDGKVAVVTGASSGIGCRLAGELKRRGATVVGVARRRQGEVTVQCDVADIDAYRRVLADAEAAHGSIDILVNNAASTDAGHDLRALFETNFFAVVAGTEAVLPGMRARGSGVVVNVSSDSARAPTPGEAAYSASKAALSAYTEAIAHEVAADGVHLHVLYPGWVPTAMGLSGGSKPPRIVRRTEQQIADLVCQRMGGPSIELNAARVAVLAPLARAFAPRLYRRSISSQAPG